MLKKIYIMNTVIASTLFFGCTNSTDVKVAENKNVKYQPMKINNIPPAPKQESIIDIDKADMQKHKRDLKELSDFDKYMRGRDIRLRDK